MPRRATGFTLLEVLVALVIVAFGMGALLSALTSAADNVSILRDKSLAQWIALNLIADQRLALQGPGTGTVEGDVRNFGNGNWHWQEQINNMQGVPGIRLITVRVSRTGNADSSSGNAANSSSSNTNGNNNSASSAASTANGSIGAGSLGANANGLGSSNSSLGANSALGGSGGLGGNWGIGASGTVTVTSSGSLGASGSLNAGAPNGLGNVNGLGASSTASSSSSSSSASRSTEQNWLVTLIGFRGDSVGAASGEVPDWTGGTFQNANGTGTTNGTTPGSGTGLAPVPTPPSSTGLGPTGLQ